jgi:hypothetical protein
VLPEVKASCPYGQFERHEKLQGRVVSIEESYRIDMARVPPGDYERFGQFAGEVDLVQGREMLAEKVRLGEEVDGQRIEIVDEQGRSVGTIPTSSSASTDWRSLPRCRIRSAGHWPNC